MSSQEKHQLITDAELKEIQANTPEDCPVRKAFENGESKLVTLLSPFLCESKVCHKCRDAK